MNPLFYALCVIIGISLIVSFDTWKSGRNGTLRMALIRRETNLAMILVMVAVGLWFIIWLVINGPDIASAVWDRFLASFHELNVPNLPAENR